MIIDQLSKLESYSPIHPALEYIAKYIREHDLSAMPDGRIVLDDIGGYVNMQTMSAKNIDESVWEAHRKMIDIQIPLTGDEMMGYIPVEYLEAAPYDEAKDISFYTEKPEQFLTVKKGMFAIFFPQDAHAPGITSGNLKKAVFKIPVLKK